MIFRDPNFKIFYLRQTERTLPFANQQVETYYAPSGRKAIAKGIEVLNLKAEDNVLVPAYICREAIAPFRTKNIKVKYYKIREDFTFDRESLSQLTDEKTKAVVYVNYFGLSKEIKKYRQYCDEHNLYLIEDNAHTIFSEMGSLLGDILVFSLRKIYPIANGGILVVRKGVAHSVDEGGTLTTPRWRMDDCRFMAERILRNMYQHIATAPVNRLLLSVRENRERNDYLQNDLEATSAISTILRSSIELMKRLDLHQIIEKRRENFNYLLERLKICKNSSVQILFQQLEEQMCPLAFPLIVRRDTKHFINYLFLNGFVTYTWPHLPQEVMNDPQYAFEKFLSQNLVLLPIHQSMVHEQVDRMGAWVNKFSSGHERKH